MGSFGENLRREREMRGVSLEEISAATKIGVRFFKAIEDEDFSKLPGGIFTRSFIRAYARYLGLDEDPLIAEYQLAAKAKGEEVDLSRLSLPVSHASRDRRRRSAWVGAAAAVLLLIAGYGLWRHSQKAKDLASVAVNQVAPKKALPAPSAKPPASAPAPAEKSSDGPVVAQGQEPASPAGQSAADSVPAAATGAAPPALQAPAETDYGNSLVLQVATTERSWVAIDADGKTVMEGIMTPHQLKTFKAQKSFDVLTGNAQGVILTLNGRTLKPLGREGEVKSIHLTRENLKKLKAP